MNASRVAVSMGLVCLIVGVGIVPLLSQATGARGSNATVAEDELRIAVSSDGDARLTLVTTYTLTNESEAAAFRGLQNDTATQDHLRRSFAARLSRLANRTATQTGRQMRVTNATITMTTYRNTTGVVAVSVEWTQLAAQNGSELVLAEPFASGVALDRPVVVTAPDGYQITAVTPAPLTWSNQTVRWHQLTGDKPVQVRFKPVDDAAIGGVWHVTLPTITLPSITLPTISPAYFVLGMIGLLILLPALVIALFQRL